MSRKIKIIVERHETGYVAYPLGLCDGVSIVGEGDTYDEALADVTSAIRFTLENAAEKPVFRDETAVLEAFIAEAEVTAGAPVSRSRAEGQGHPSN
jgi:predicted RNase H-like HicB family nuclease